MNAEHHTQTQQQSQQQQQQQQQQHEQQQQQHQQQQHKQQQHYQQQRTHHVYCSYEKDVVCDTIETQQQQQQQHQQQHHSMQHAQAQYAQADTQQEHDEQQQQQQPHIYCHAHSTAATPTHHRHAHMQQQSQQRKHSHSHSPHRSRHTSPHSQHSHSLHSSPHQTHTHRAHAEHEAKMALAASAATAGGDSSLPRSSLHGRSSASSHALVQHQQQQYPQQQQPHHHHHRRRRRHPPLTHQHSGGSGGSAGRHMTGGHGGHRGIGGGGGHGNGHEMACTRRHRSTTDVSNVSINTCHDPTCVDREVQEIFVRKKCCSSSSRTELAQYFAEDLYGTTSRRPSSCCTSSDYCYQTDSTSLYGSRSSLSRNNSIKSATALGRKRRMQQRATTNNYMSVSLCGLNDGSGGRVGGGSGVGGGIGSSNTARCHRGSLSSVFDRAKRAANAIERSGGGGMSGDKLVMLPTLKSSSLMRQTSRDALSQELPDYACSPSPIRWSFLADGKSPTEFERGDSTDDLCKGATWSGSGGGRAKEPKPSHSHREHTRRERERERDRDRGDRVDQRGHRASTSSAGGLKWRDESPYSDFEKSTTVLFHHQEGEPYNDCCSNNYIQCNTYLDQDLQITSEDIHQYLSKGNRAANDVLNNSKNYPFQPSNALEFQYKNNFSSSGNNNNNSSHQSQYQQTATTSSEGGDSLCRGYNGYFRRNSSKETNLNQNVCTVGGGGAGGAGGGCTMDESSTCSTPMSPTNINLSSSTNNINIVFNSSIEANANEVKFINTARGGTAATASAEPAVSYEAHHSGYLPYTFPTYDYTNMSANSLFDKPLGIDQLPKEFAAAASTTSAAAMQKKHSISSQHSSLLLQSPGQASGRHCASSFESFDAASNHNLLSQRNSCQFSTPHTPLSPNSPASSSCVSTAGVGAACAAINPAAAGSLYTHGQQSPQHYGYQLHRRHSPSVASMAAGVRHHHHHTATDGFKFGNALKKVRRRARKYTEFLRKK